MKHTGISLFHTMWAGIVLLAFAMSATPVLANTWSRYAGIYSSPPPAAGSASGPVFSVSLGADGSATISQDCGKRAVTSFGRWTDSGSRITVNFQSTGDQPAQSPIVFQPSHDGLQAVSWDHGLWGKITPPRLKKEDSDWHNRSGKRLIGFL